MGFVIDNWLTIISLLVALIGGVPGIIAVNNQRKNRPIFRFELVHLLSGAFDSTSEGSHLMVLLTGTASNEGNTILTPSHFELECAIDGKWIKFQKKLIPQDLQFKGDNYDVQLVSPWQNDLQRYGGTITTGLPLHGHLMFISFTVSLEKIKDNPDLLEMKLTCCDIFGKKFITPIELNLNAITSDTSFPKHGLLVSSKV